jgi:hypothetical protein
LQHFFRPCALQAAAGELSAHTGNAFAHGAKPKHGGVVQAANDLSFELVAKGDTATIYIEDRDKPFSAAGATGKLTVLNGAQKTEATLIDKDVVFAAKLAPISWVPACVLAASRRRHAGCINARPIPHNLVVFAEPAQYRLVNALPYTCLHPFVQATPAGHSATAPKLTRQILPRYSSPENEQNPG